MAARSRLVRIAAGSAGDTGHSRTGGNPCTTESLHNQSVTGDGGRVSAIWANGQEQTIAAGLRYGTEGSSDEFARGGMQKAATRRPHATFGADVADLHGNPLNLFAGIGWADAQEGPDVAELFRQAQAQAV